VAVRNTQHARIDQTVTESTIKVSRAHIMVLYEPILLDN
jgi:hypothetical protein